MGLTISFYLIIGPYGPLLQTDSQVTEDSIRIKWISFDDNYNGYVVTYTPVDGRTMERTLLPVGTEEFSFVGLSPATTYYLCVFTYAGGSTPDTGKQSDPVCTEETTSMYFTSASQSKNAICAFWIMRRVLSFAFSNS